MERSSSHVVRELSFLRSVDVEMVDVEPALSHGEGMRLFVRQQSLLAVVPLPYPRVVLPSTGQYDMLFQCCPHPVAERPVDEIREQLRQKHGAQVPYYLWRLPVAPCDGQAVHCC